MIMRLTASEEKSLSLQLFFDRGNGRNLDKMKAVSSDALMMGGETGGQDGITFRSGVRAILEGGSAMTIGNRLIVKDADAVTLILSAATSYRYEDPERQCMRVIERVAEENYEALRQTHIDDYQLLFKRVNLEIGQSTKKQELSTDERLDLVRKGEEDLDLISNYFDFGRYLLISSSRPNSLPANLQGIWNEQMLPPWDSKFTININTEMNYWPAEVCNLSECHEPLFDLIEKMREPGKKTASVMYNCRGFTAHHNTDIWGDTAPQDSTIHSTVWPMGAAWLTLHLWEHYEYSQDKDFLSTNYETMKEAALFFVDFLIENKEGLLITSPSSSPENTYILPNGVKAVLCEAQSMDSQIIHDLFSNCIV